ncbi:MAG: TIGR01777 family protein [Planctomycetes bacterium]|nr:TIGR01777 family protein [Planctomycetota bacterium]
MPRFAASTYLPVSPGEAFAWHARPGALARLIPPWQDVRIVQNASGLFDDARTVLSIGTGPGPLRRRWVALHRDCRPGAQFRDVQERGPFAAWDHLHRFDAEDDDGCRLSDIIDYRLPYGWLGRRLLGRTIERDLARAFAWRHRRTLADLGRHRSFRDQRPLLIALSGSRGLVGSQLAPFLTGGGHTVLPLVRPGGKRGAGIPWDPQAGTLDAEALSACDAIIHLGGAGVADGRWTRARKHLILESRVRSTRLLAETLARSAHKPRVLIVASAVGWYGDRGDTIVDETNPSGDGFLAEVCRAWEDACEPARAAGIRVVNVRIGMVVTRRGGALARMLTPFRLGLGGPIGSGDQWISWISLDDLVYLIHHALLSQTVQGPVNAVAPTPVRQRDFARELSGVMRRPCAVRTPAWAVRAAFGQMGTEVLLGGARVVSRTLEDEVFAFSAPTLHDAFEDEFGTAVARPAKPHTSTSSGPIG